MQKLTNWVCSACTIGSAMTIKDLDSILSIVLTTVCLVITIFNFVKTRLDKAKEDGVVTPDEIVEIIEDVNKSLDDKNKK